MSKSAERGKGCSMYQHTFYLLSGDTIVGESISPDLAHVTLGGETIFVVTDAEKQTSIPFFSVGYIETTEL